MDLIIRKSGVAGKKPWALELRYHGPAETEYHLVTYLSDEMAREIIAAGAPYWLYGEPDWEQIRRQRDMETVRLLREEADRIEREMGGDRHGA